jgi:cytidine deaminase
MEAGQTPLPSYFGGVQWFTELQKMSLDDATLAKLKDAAKAASGRAYCPYSKFPVGAAVLTDAGEIFSGCNVENASFGLTICAERNAIFQAVANGARRMRAVLIFTPSIKPTSPCGACRQVINEFGPDVMVFSTCNGKQVSRWSISNLLTDAFGPDSL